MEELEVVVDVQRKSGCFVVIADAFHQAKVLPRIRSDGSASVFALELRIDSKGTSAVSRKYVGGLSWGTAVQSGVVTGPSAGKPGSLKTNQISFAPSFARDLCLQPGDLVGVAVIHPCPEAATVLVAPASVDDSEIVELNALRIEMSLLQFLRVVHVGLTVTVPVYEGMCAKIVVESITSQHCGTNPKCAMLCDGTELHVATRQRQRPNAPTADSGAKPIAAVLRCSARPLRMSNSDNNVIVHPETALAMHWNEGLAVGLLHLSEIAFLEPQTASGATTQSAVPVMEPSALRSKASRGVVKIASDEAVAEHNLNRDVLYVVDALACFSYAVGNILVMPSPPDNVDRGVRDLLSRCSEYRFAPPRAFTVPLRQLAEVHGDVVTRLSAEIHASHSDGSVCNRNAFGPQNILLCGSQGTGKSTVAISAATRVNDDYPRNSQEPLFAMYLACDDSKNFLPDLHKALYVASLNVPCTLVLDNFDKVCPSQSEGGVSAISNATALELESVLYAARVLGGPAAATLRSNIAAKQASVSVVCTAQNRETVNEAFRTARSFGSCYKLDPLSPESRLVMVLQELDDEQTKRVVSSSSIKRLIIKTTENYTPFDIKAFCRRFSTHFIDAVYQQGGMMDMDGEVLRDIATNALKTVGTKFQSLAQQGVAMMTQSSSAGGEGHQPSWDDIGGLAEVKKVLHDTLILPSKMPKLFAKLPLKTRSGVLLFGPSGCGKTYALQSVVAAEKLNCIVVNGPEIFGKYIGQSEQKVREIFERAQAAAPAVIFFDEFDSVAPQRGHDNTGVTDRVVNQLLCYLDGVEARKDVFVVAASSRPDLIDAALLRPGRLDKAVYCPMPNLEERIDILRAHLRKLPNSQLTFNDIAQVAERAEGWTSADLAALVASTSMMVMQKTIDLSRELSHLNIGSSASTATMTAESSTVFLAQAPLKSKAKLSEDLEMLVAPLLKSSVNAAQTPAHAASQPQRVMPSVTLADMWEAMSKTRRSMTDRDIMKQQLFFEKFILSRQPGGEPVAKPGTKMTMA